MKKLADILAAIGQRKRIWAGLVGVHSAWPGSSFALSATKFSIVQDRLGFAGVRAAVPPPNSPTGVVSHGQSHLEFGRVYPHTPPAWLVVLHLVPCLSAVGAQPPCLHQHNDENAPFAGSMVLFVYDCAGISNL